MDTVVSCFNFRVIFFYKSINQNTNNKQVYISRIKEEKPKPKLKSIKSHILVTGNSFWGRYTNDHAMKSDLKEKFPFARLNEFNRDNYNAWITGLECPSSQKGVNITSAEQEENLVFNCNPSYIPEFSKWFNIVTLANNHTDNMGEDGFRETQKNLEKSGIQHIGHYDPYKTDDICEVVALPITAEYEDGDRQNKMLPITLCGYHFVFKLPKSDAIEKMRKYSKVMPTISLPHGGAEYKPGPDEIKTNLYHSMIDNGADMVLGDHPHWVQNTEAYKGKMIVYSMGNFMFDQQTNKEVTRSAAIDITMTLKDGQSLDNVSKWLELGPSCKKCKDNCLEKSQKLNLEKIGFNYDFDVIATSDVGYQTHPDPSQLSSIKQRLNWGDTLSKLK